MRRAEDLRQREEQARLEAIREAEVAKARADAEAAARLQALKEQQAHEAALMRLKQDDSKKKLKIGIGVVAGILLLVAVGGGMALKSNSEEAAKAAQLAEEARKRSEQEQEDLRKAQAERDEELKKLQQEISDLRTMKERATTDEEKAEIQRKLDAKVAGGGGGGKRPPPTAKEKPKKACNCTPGDPLCDCF
jgi:colicin import membrane protein